MAARSADYPEHVPIEELRQRARAFTQRMLDSGRDLHPVQAEGRSVAKSFWGQAWCNKLERYSDSALSKGRTYVRRGAVLDLTIAPGTIKAMVSGASLYEVALMVEPVSSEAWARVQRRSIGLIDSREDLHAGKISERVREVLFEELLPSRSQIHGLCTCPVGGDFCKHQAAALYGVGVRLDVDAEELFRLRQVDERMLIQPLLPNLELSPRETKAYVPRKSRRAARRRRRDYR
jgi:uncharacterized Zn finger protein